METYIVQVYRRHNEGGLVGVVERVGNGGGTRFGSMQELWGFLTVGKSGSQDEPPIGSEGDRGGRTTPGSRTPRGRR